MTYKLTGFFFFIVHMADSKSGMKEKVDGKEDGVSVL